MISCIEDFHGFLENFYNLEKIRHPDYKATHLNVERFEQLLEVLGSPHHSLKFIHIAGTKGKGSTATLLSYLLVEYGYQTGLYLSPHLVRINERISINSCDIDDSELIRHANQVQSILSFLEYKPSYFEILTAIAILHFNHHKCDYVVLETGLGGRLDTTNFCKPILTIITSISVDHTAILGNSVVEIAKEKAGIIKQGIEVILGKNSKEVIEILKSEVMSKKAKPIVFGEDFSISNCEMRNERLFFDFFLKNQNFSIESDLMGLYQSENIANALMALYLTGHDLIKVNIDKALLNIKLPGRFQKVNDNPLVILDAAHNTYSAIQLRDNFVNLYKNYHRVLIIGILRNKDYKSIIENLVQHFDEVVISKIGSQNGENDISGKLYDICMTLNKNSRQCSDIKKLFCEIKNNEDSKKVYLITGSFYLVGEVLELFAS